MAQKKKPDTWEIIKVMFRQEFFRLKEKYIKILSDFIIRILLIFVKPAIKITARLLPWILPVARAYGRLSELKKFFVLLFFTLCLFFLVIPKNTFLYKYVYALVSLPLTAVQSWWFSNLSTYALLSQLIDSYLAARGFTLYNSFAWWSLSATLICPLVFYWVVWNYSFWLVKRDGSIIGRPWAYSETDFEEKYETDFDDLFHYGLFWVQNIMMVRYIFSYVEQVDKRANFDKYYYKYAQFKIRYGLWYQPSGRKDGFEFWYRALLSARHIGYKKQVFSPQDVVVFNKLWRNKAYLLTNGLHYGSWMQIVDHNPKTGRPRLRKDPVFGLTEAFYTVMHQAEYWGFCYFPYINVDNLRFPIKGYH